MLVTASLLIASALIVTEAAQCELSLAVDVPGLNPVPNAINALQSDFSLIASPAFAYFVEFQAFRGYVRPDQYQMTTAHTCKF